MLQAEDDINDAAAYLNASSETVQGPQGRVREDS
jgi:hypothetical protein